MATKPFFVSQNEIDFIDQRLARIEEALNLEPLVAEKVDD